MAMKIEKFSLFYRRMCLDRELDNLTTVDSHDLKIVLT